VNKSNYNQILGMNFKKSLQIIQPENKLISSDTNEGTNIAN